MKQTLLIISLLCFATLSAKPIKNQKFKQFLKNFKEVKLPFNIELKEENWLSFKEAEQFLNEEVDPMDRRGTTFYTGELFYQKYYIGVIVTRSWTPGAFGIYNSSPKLYTFTYGGTLIDQYDLGDDLNDTNPGSNDYHATSNEVKISFNRITTITTETHATLIEDEEDEKNFKKIEKSSDEAVLSPIGTFLTSPFYDYGFKDIKQNILLLHSKQFTIRVDQLKNGHYRYISWSKKGTISDQPDLMLNKGKLFLQNGEKQYRFTTGNHRYICIDSGNGGQLIVYHKKRKIVDQTLTSFYN